MNANKRTITILLAAVLALSLLLTACGNGRVTSTGDNTTPGSSSTPNSESNSTPNDATEPYSTPSETEPSTPGTSEPPHEIEAVMPQIGTISVFGTYYKNEQCVYSLPDGMMCAGAEKNDDFNVFTTLWSEGLRSKDAKTVIILEHDEKVTDFETRTAEQWWQYCYIGQDMSPFKNIKIEKTTVDGYPAIRLTDETDDIDGSILYSECWVIDAPNGCIVFAPLNSEISSNYNEHSKWVADIIATVLVGHEVVEKPSDINPGSERNSGLFR